MSDERHIPVLLAEVVDVLNPQDGGLYVDGTFGAGGYSRAILEAADCAVIGIDRDPSALREGAQMVDAFDGRLTLLRGQFGDMAELLKTVNVGEVDGIALDLGVSSMQLDRDERGFSFLRDGPLDMRMSSEGQDAAEVVNTFDEFDLFRIISVYGEEKQAKRIAREIIRARDEKRLTRTAELADIVSHAVGGRKGARVHPATKTFQGIRMFVNDELRELVKALRASEKLLKRSGKVAVVTFHSLEDKIVKKFFRGRSGYTAGVSRHMPADDGNAYDATFQKTSSKVIRPSAVEIEGNPRARSSKLRWAERSVAAVQEFDREAFEKEMRII